MTGILVRNFILGQKFVLNVADTMDGSCVWLLFWFSIILKSI